MAETWAEQLPAKRPRWVIATGLGSIADSFAPVISGASVSAVDNFVLDKYLKGRKPKSFIDGAYKKFVVRNSNATP